MGNLDYNGSHSISNNYQGFVVQEPLIEEKVLRK